MIKSTEKENCNRGGKPQWLSFKSKILLCFLILALFFPVFYGLLHLIPIQNRSLFGKSPTDIENALWISEESSYFKVMDSEYCEGVLRIDGVKVPVCYVFNYDNRVELYDNTEPEEWRDLGTATCTCNGKTAKMEIQLYNGEKMKLTFIKQKEEE